MTGGRWARRLLAERRAAMAVEFALVSVPLFLISFGAIDLGLILWTRTALESVAADAARCGAIQAAACTGSNTISSFVQAEAANWVLSGVVTSTTNPLTVNVNGSVNTASCPAITVGTFETVEIVTSYLASGWLPPPFGNYRIDVCASFAS